MSESTNTPILQIFNEFTYEQLWHIINGMKRNSNNLTKEGRNLNAHRARQKKFKEKYSDEEIKKLLQDNL
ncbi:MAG: hypothetical protein LBG59_07915 [Candidatus Peribacteria bacterium]|nr:hypothetical protein [Candidatus Peribacteria bacterium]